MGAMGLASSFAQVYSVNAVGYVNLTLKPGFNLIANPLDLKTDNVVSKVLAGVPDGTVVYRFVAGAYVINTYDLSGVGGWDPDPNMAMAPGEAMFVRIPGAADVTVTFVGEVMQGALSSPVPQGFSLKASQVPQAGKVATLLGYPAGDGDVVYKFVAGAYQIFTYDLSGTGGWDPSEPDIAVGEGFWSRRVAAAGAWTRNFSVNP